jgi:hypothetical protein
MKTKAHMTKSYWYDTELTKLLNIGYDGREAHALITERLATMDQIEWAEEVEDIARGQNQKQ